MADDVEPNIIYVSPEAWDELQRELNRPPKAVPALVELMRRERRITVAPEDSAP